MRSTLTLLLLTVALLLTVWLAGETWLANVVTRWVRDNPQITAATVTELRDTRRMGLEMTEVAVALPQGEVRLPRVALWVPPARPTELHATLPDEGSFQPAGGGAPLRLGSRASEAWLRVAPMNELSVSRLVLGLQDMTLDGAPLAADVSAEARLVGFGDDAPPAAGAAYDATVAAHGIALSPLTAGRMDGAADVSGPVRVWLSGPLGAGRQPELVGLRPDGVRIDVGDLSATLRGRVLAGPDGLAEGVVAVDTPDMRGWIERAATLGLVPKAMVTPVTAAALALAASPAEGAAPTATPAAGPALPPPAGGEARLLITFRGGRTHVGPLAVGPAPRLR